LLDRGKVGGYVYGINLSETPLKPSLDKDQQKVLFKLCRKYAKRFAGAKTKEASRKGLLDLECELLQTIVETFSEAR
jgi:hypothetical protein